MIKTICKLLFTMILLLLLPLGMPTQAASSGASMTNLRWTSRNDGNPPFVRIAMDVTKAVKAEAAIDEEGKNFELVLKNTSM